MTFLEFDFETEEFSSSNYSDTSSTRTEQPSISEVAERYRDRGWVPIPVEHGGKRPIRYGWQKNTLESPIDAFQPGMNVAIVLGDASGGIVDIDLDCPEAIAAAEQFLPATGVIFGPATNPKSHWVYRVKDCGGNKSFKADGQTLVEYRANGANTVFPPSVYESGEARVFSREGEPAEVPRDELQRCVAKVAAVALLVKHWAEGSRHEATLAVSGALHRAGWTKYEIEKIVRAICEISGDDDIRGRIIDVETTVQRIEKRQTATGLPRLENTLGGEVARRLAEWLNLGSDAPKIGHNGPPGEEDASLTEIGNADRFVSQHGADARFCSELGSWFLWRGGRWEQDKTYRVKKLAEETIRSIFGEAGDISDSRDREAVAKWANRSCSQHGIEATVALAMPKLPISLDAFDTDPLLLNFINGTVELRTGRLREHRRNDWITKQVPHEFSEKATCPRFERFLTEVTSGDGELIAFLHRALGYSLTGLMDAQCMFIAYGDGANGKSTLLNLFNDLLGDYSKSTPVHTFIAKRGDGGASDDLARLRGARYVVTSETETNQPLAEALIKRVTGGDTVTARHLYGGYFDYQPKFKIWMSTNNRPKISGGDKAIWRRLKEIPFLASFPAGDPKLPVALRAEAEGILAWAVRGYLEFQRVGSLKPPNCVEQATQDYREEMDMVGQFLKEQTISSPGQRTPKAEAYKAFLQWTTDNRTENLSKTEFGRRLKRVGIQERKSGSTHYWLDIALVTDQEPELDFEAMSGSEAVPSGVEAW